jgi:hypothetical protein
MPRLPFGQASTSLAPMIFGRSFERDLAFHIFVCEIWTEAYAHSKFELCIPVPTHCRSKPEFNYLVILLESGVANGSADARQRC